MNLTIENIEQHEDILSTLTSNYLVKDLWDFHYPFTRDATRQSKSRQSYFTWKKDYLQFTEKKAFSRAKQEKFKVSYSHVIHFESVGNAALIGRFLQDYLPPKHEETIASITTSLDGLMARDEFLSTCLIESLLRVHGLLDTFMTAIDPRGQDYDKHAYRMSGISLGNGHEGPRWDEKHVLHVDCYFYLDKLITTLQLLEFLKALPRQDDLRYLLG